MHTFNLAAFAGVGFLVVGAMLSVSDLALFDKPYALLMGPISWMVGCALMVAWAVGRVAVAVGYGSEEQKPEHRTSRAAAGAGTRAVV